MKNFAVFLFLLSSVLSFGQGISQDISMGRGVNSILYTPSYSGNNIPDIPEPDYQYDDWKEMHITGNEGEQILAKYANYYPPTKQIIFKDKIALKELYADKVISAKIGTDLYRSFFYEDPKKNIVKGFFLTLCDGHIALIKQVELRERRKVNNLMGDINKKPKFDKIDRYYYAIHEGLVQSFKPSKKTVLELFHENESELKAYIKSNKLRLKKEKDLIKAFAFANSLNPN